MATDKTAPHTDAHHHTSLADVHNSIDPGTKKSPWRRVAAFFGPAYLIAVGYMDPGNWATDLQGGSAYGYTLIWVLVMSNVMALLLQSLASRLGIVRGRDLAQCNREVYPKTVNFVLYLLAEIAIAACDLAEVLGMAIGLQLLLHIPLIWGVLITLLDTFLLLYLQRLGMRKMEAFIIALVGIIGVSFLIELFFAQPSGMGIISGLVPRIPDTAALYIAIGIIGATVMPHNLYLHSALVQTRKVKRDPISIRKAIRFNAIDSGIALNLALFVNAAILILAARVFHQSGMHNVAQLKDAHMLLGNMLGNKWASHLFAFALIAAGQSSTVTGTLAGQIIMEGYLSLRINPWARRLLTRLLAVGPAVLVILIAGEGEVDAMLVFSQVLLSVQLSFAVIPLIHFVSDKHRMNGFHIKPMMMFFSWVVAIVILGLNGWLVFQGLIDWLHGPGMLYLKIPVIVLTLGLLGLLVYVIIYPLRVRRKERHIDIHKAVPAFTVAPPLPFRTIAVALDYSEHDSKVIQYALQLGNAETHYILLHIVESATAKISGQDVADYETQQDKERLDAYANYFRTQSLAATPVLGYRNRTKEIARIVAENNADLLVLGSHGHRQLNDFVYGETINTVRHMVKVPVFIAQ